MNENVSNPNESSLNPYPGYTSKRAGRDLAGRRFGRWTVVRRTDKPKHGSIVWECRCDCGTVRNVMSSNLVSGGSESCGCLLREISQEINRTHGGSKSAEYTVWMNMKQRCTNPKNTVWRYYGGKGITICDRWKESFENFMQDMGPKPSPDHSIDRIQGSGNYEPSNCRWVDWSVQSDNRSSTKRITWNGKTQSMASWSRELGIPYMTLRERFRQGWTVERALTQPHRYESQR